MIIHNVGLKKSSESKRELYQQGEIELRSVRYSMTQKTKIKIYVHDNESEKSYLNNEAANFEGYARQTTSNIWTYEHMNNHQVSWYWSNQMIPRTEWDWSQSRVVFGLSMLQAFCLS